MLTVKTAISLPEALFQKADQLAEELNVSRSRLFVMAIERMLHEYESRKMLEALNIVYADAPDLEDQLLLEGMRRHQHSLQEKAEDEW